MTLPNFTPKLVVITNHSNFMKLVKHRHIFGVLCLKTLRFHANERRLSQHAFQSHVPDTQGLTKGMESNFSVAC